MNYKEIHDCIIYRAKTRIPSKKLYYENHHILPKCEGGDPNGSTVKLTVKEHRLIHLLRSKFLDGEHALLNEYAFHLLNNRKNDFCLMAHLAAKKSHILYKERDPIGYSKRQKHAGKAGGVSAYEKKTGFHSLSEEEMMTARRKGNETIVKNKLGMFSDEYREQHKKMLQKKVKTPDGIFESMSECAQFYKIANGTVTYRCNNTNHAWEYV